MSFGNVSASFVKHIYSIFHPPSISDDRLKHSNRMRSYKTYDPQAASVVMLPPGYKLKERHSSTLFGAIQDLR